MVILIDNNYDYSFGRMGAVDQVVAFVNHSVRIGRYSIGDRLPNEAELATLIGVGRSSLREGMRILAAYGLVEIRHGEGTFIIDKTTERFFELLGYMPESNVQDFVELRHIIEMGSVLLACRKVTQPVLSKLQELVDQMDYKNGLDICVQADRDFHKLLITCTENPLLIQIEKMIYRMRSEMLYKIMRYPDIVQCAKEDHQVILDALKEGDEEKAQRAVKKHLEEVKYNITKNT